MVLYRSENMENFIIIISRSRELIKEKYIMYSVLKNSILIKELIDYMWSRYIKQSDKKTEL